MTYLTRAVFAFASLLLLLAAMALIGFGVKDALQGIGSPDKSGADAVLDVLGYVIVAIAVFIFAESALIVALLFSRRRNRFAEQSLREGERKLRMISSSSQDAILMIDHEGKTIFWNLAAEAMFGYSEQEALGRNLHTLLAPSKFHEKFHASFRRFQDTGEGEAIGKTVRLTALRRNGEEFPVELSISAVRVGDRWNAVGIVRDISNQKRQRHTITVRAAGAER